MRYLAVVLLAGGALAGGVNGEQKPMGGDLRSNVRSQFMSCEETYGETWIPCGDEVTCWTLPECSLVRDMTLMSFTGQRSRFCYSPALGQSCCDTDYGYCDAGSHCAPVAGHCCLDGEDLMTCARNAGFELPVDVDLANRTGPIPGVRISGTGGFNISALLPTNSSASDEAPSTAGSSSPYIQVSIARKHHGTLAWMAAGIGAVGLFMFSC